MHAKSSSENSYLSMSQRLQHQTSMQDIQMEQNHLMSSYLANQVNQAIKFSCVLDLYDIIQENHHIPDEQIQQQYQNNLLQRQRGPLLQNSVQEIGEQVRILQNNGENFIQKVMRCLGIVKRIAMQPFSKYILSLFIQKYVTQLVWEKTNYCLSRHIAAGLTSLTFGLFYLKLKDSKKFLHENYLWFFGSSIFIYFNIEQNFRESNNMALRN